MDDIFDRISADFSVEFLKKNSNFLEDDNQNSLFQRICDTTGVIFIKDESSNKLIGPWHSIRRTHDILSGFLLFQTISNENSVSIHEKKSRSFPVHRDVTLLNSIPMQEMEDLNLTERNLVQEKTLKDGADTNLPFTEVNHADKLINSNSGNKMEFRMFDTEGLCPQRNVDEQNFFCRDCSYSGASRRNLRDHMNRMHFRPFRCSICLRGFGLKKDLKRHQKYSDCSKRAIKVGEGRRFCHRHERKLRHRYFDQYERLQSENLNDFSLNREMDISAIPTSNEKGVSTANSDVCMMLSQNAVKNMNHKPLHQTSITSKENLDQQLNKSDATVKLQMAKERKENEDELQIKIKEEILSGEEDMLDTVAHSKVNTSSSSEVNEKNVDTGIVSNTQPSLSNLPTLLHMSDMATPEIKQFEKENLQDEYLTLSVSGQRELKYVCKSCSFTVNRRQLVEDHIKRIHIKQFRCDVCGTMFGLLKDLNRHYRRTHKIMIETQRRGRRAQNGPPFLAECDPDA